MSIPLFPSNSSKIAQTLGWLPKVCTLGKAWNPLQELQKPLLERFRIEKRVMGIEPITTAWKAVVLPLNYTRIGKGNG